MNGETPALPVYLHRDADGNLHVDVPRMLACFGFADTPANRDMAIASFQEVAREKWPGVAVEVVP